MQKVFWCELQSEASSRIKATALTAIKAVVKQLNKSRSKNNCEANFRAQQRMSDCGGLTPLLFLWSKNLLCNSEAMKQ
ncbi:hypothetical protein AOG27_10600 [Pseudoalteromonas lipolytica]|uniref:Uncharacterized protein n=1 Tax=Pseudoalteromonas lipolytica TaxID=570156 RepID=A0A0P7D4W4_9GAMM|nr:hypothetical protein AOG27_10600 [Pseudoalteromonas lipolytica]